MFRTFSLRIKTCFYVLFCFVLRVSIKNYLNTQCGFSVFLPFFPICWVLVRVKDFNAFAPYSVLHFQEYFFLSVSNFIKKQPKMWRKKSSLSFSCTKKSFNIFHHLNNNYSGKQCFSSCCIQETRFTLYFIISRKHAGASHRRKGDL